MVQKAKGNQGDAVEVLVAAGPIQVATRITGTMLTTKTVARGLMPEDAFTDMEVLATRVTAMTIAPGIPITRGMLAPPGAEPGLRAKIPAGQRAVSVSVNEESAVAGFVMPGSRVDVYSGNDVGRGRLILSDVEVGAVGQSMNEVGKDGKTVRITKSMTLFLSPDEIELLPSGRRNLRLALRGDLKDPDNDSDERGAFWSNVIAGVLAKSPVGPPEDEALTDSEPPAELKRHVVEVKRGNQVERLVFVEWGEPGKYVPEGDIPIEDELGKEFGDSEYGGPSAIMEIRE